MILLGLTQGHRYILHFPGHVIRILDQLHLMDWSVSRNRYTILKGLIMQVYFYCY